MLTLTTGRMLTGAGLNNLSGIFGGIQIALSTHQRYQTTWRLEDLEQTIRLYYETMSILLQPGQPIANSAAGDLASQGACGTPGCSLPTYALFRKSHSVYFA